MQIYFGRAECDTDFNLIDLTTRREYYYGVEVASAPGGFDDVMIYDSLDRHVPISTQHIPELIAALQRALELSRVAEQFYELANDVMDPEHVEAL